jgi:hypothetical protein
MDSKSNYQSSANYPFKDINLKDIFSDDEFRVMLKYLADEEVKDKLSQKKVTNELKSTPSSKKSLNLYDRTDFIFKLLRISSQKLKLGKEPALAKSLEW